MITLKSSWEELNTLPNWIEWLSKAKLHDERLEACWKDTSACIDCIHINHEHAWCNLYEAPATRNPAINCFGMACCGFGKEKLGQQELFHGYDFE